MGRIQGDLLERTLRLAVHIVGLMDRLPDNVKGWVLGKQLLRSGTSIGANVREADQAPSRADFANKCCIARKEAGETHYWLELCRRTRVLSATDTDDLIGEVDELTRVLAAVIKSTREAIGNV